MRTIIIYSLRMNRRHVSRQPRQVDDSRPEPGVEFASRPALSVQRLSSNAIFGGALEVEIEHNGALYRLRQTSLGKLILTK